MPIESLPILGKIVTTLARLTSDLTVERIKAEHAKELEELEQTNRLLLQQLDQKHQFKLAALDKRLQAHQEAYTLWWNLRNASPHREQAEEEVLKCQEWWVNNNLYLTKKLKMPSTKPFLLPIFTTFFYLIETRPEKRLKRTSEKSTTLER